MWKPGKKKQLYIFYKQKNPYKNTLDIYKTKTQ